MLKGTISRADYLQRVLGKAIAGPEYLEELQCDLRLCLETEVDDQRLIDMADSFLVDWRRGYEGILQIVPLEAAKAVLQHDSFEALNWHYDRKAACLLVNMRRGRHEALAAVLYQLYVDPQPKSRKGLEEAAELFIDHGLGWFKSSTSFGRMLKGTAVKFSAQERAVFGEVPTYEH